MLCLVLLFSSVSVSAGLNDIDTEDGEVMAEFFRLLLSVTEAQYRFDVTNEELLQAAVDAILKEHPELFAELAKGAYSALDENSQYLTTEEYESRYSDVSGEFAGIGINMTEDLGRVVISSPMEGSPAMEAGIQTGDIIVAVNGEDVTGYNSSKISDLIKGEEGTDITLQVQRGDQILTFLMKRAIIKVNPVQYYKLDKNNAGYIKLTTFNGNASDSLHLALEDLSSQGVDKIILDLRNNLGGLIREAVAVASYFLPDDAVVVQESYKKETKDRTYTAYHTQKKFKVVVLVNEYSASASEIVAGAIKDHQAGALVGVGTYGKGTVQMTLKLRNLDAIWLTVAQYNLPNGENIHKIGIQPDYYVENMLSTVDLSNLEPLDIGRRLQIGDQGKDVLALKQRLQVMGYRFDTLDDVYDQRTADVVTSFQGSHELFPYGVADFTTQEAIVSAAKYTKVLTDNQMDKALELIYNME